MGVNKPHNGSWKTIAETRAEHNERQPIHLKLHEHKAITDSNRFSETGIITNHLGKGEQRLGTPTYGCSP